MGERTYHLLGNHHGARQLYPRPSHFRLEKPWERGWWRDAVVLACEQALRGGVSRSHARSARERRLECDFAASTRSLVARLRLSSILPFRDRGDFTSRKDFAVLLANFVCGDLVHEYPVPINYYTPESPKIWEVLVESRYHLSEVKFHSATSLALLKSQFFWRRVGDGAMKKLKQLWTINWLLKKKSHSLRPRPHVSGYFWKRRFFSPFSKKNMCIHTYRIRIFFVRPHENAKTKKIR